MRQDVLFLEHIVQPDLTEPLLFYCFVRSSTVTAQTLVDPQLVGLDCLPER